jgi:Zn-dependent protease with chaperone function
MATQQEVRVAAILKNIQRTSQTNYAVRIVNQLDGSTMQGVANPETNTIDLTARLVDSLKDDSEVAFVIAHEVAHFVNEDYKRSLQSFDKRAERIKEGLSSLDSQLKASGRGLVVRLLGVMAGVAAGAIAIKLEASRESQKHETKADEFALSYMREAGYDPQKAISALMILNGGSLPDLSFWEGLVYVTTSSHPLPQRRVGEIEKNLK